MDTMYLFIFRKYIFTLMKPIKHYYYCNVTAFHLSSLILFKNVILIFYIEKICNQIKCYFAKNK